MRKQIILISKPLKLNKNTTKLMEQYSISDFIEKTKNKEKGHGFFELETDRILEINLHGSVWIKKGAMISYEGQMKFSREGFFDHGMGNLLKKMVTGEGTQLTIAKGEGRLFVADTGKKITILKLENESIYVNGNDVLAFENTIQSDIKMMKKMSAMLAGGLFNVKLSGTGLIAITSHYDPVTLLVEHGKPVSTDPNATVAWSGGVETSFKSDVSLGTFVGRGSGDTLQMEFKGEGFVVVQPYEEVYFQASK